ncbi:hypothetical protein [Brevundimonas guildfordensis]|uniref:hypothetical protein n=1 Tax=Brevundimonas guildfordensis TaxID=2762241 RepID=UPI001CD88BD7|nr:hypothetical protein [Brevundimonas guildfordensis]
MVSLGQWLEATPVPGLLIFMAMIAAAIGGSLARRSREKAGVRSSDAKDNADGYIVSAVLGLPALLLGFTFALAVDRFETRRVLVLQEAKASAPSICMPSFSASRTVRASRRFWAIMPIIAWNWPWLGRTRSRAVRSERPAAGRSLVGDSGRARRRKDNGFLSRAAPSGKSDH